MFECIRIEFVSTSEEGVAKRGVSSVVASISTSAESTTKLATTFKTVACSSGTDTGDVSVIEVLPAAKSPIGGSSFEVVEDEEMRAL